MSVIVEQVLAIKTESDPQKRNEFIQRYLPFIIKSVSKTTGHYIQTEDSDEFSIGLEAFNEAIDRYNPDKGAFIGFANMVIRSRITDFMRRERKYQQNVNYDEQVLLKAANKVDEDLLLEIQTFKDRLQFFDMTLEALVQAAPKHKKTKLEITLLSKMVSKDDLICEKLYKSKKLPMAAIVLKYKTTKKRLKTYRSYIIGVVIVFRENLEGIKTFINTRGESDE